MNIYFIKYIINSTMKVKVIFVILFFLGINNIFCQSLTLNISSTENTDCDGTGCEYEGPTILINEVMLRPYPFDGSIYGITPSHDPATHCRGEWIELYNPDLCQSIDISCYYLGNAAYESSTMRPGGFIIPEGTIVPPRGFVIVRGVNAPAVPSNLLIQNGGNTIEIIVNDPARICIGGGYRLWFPNAGGWFAFYDSNGVPQDAISWATNDAGAANACNPGPVGGCTFSGTIVSYNSIPADRKTYISTAQPTENMTFRRLPDGGSWQINSPGTPTYGTCNSACIEAPVITCNGTAPVSVSGGNPPYLYHWNDGQSQITQTAVGLCDGTYCVTVTDNSMTTASACVTVLNNVLDVSSSATPVAVCPGQNVNLQTTYGGGQTPYAISWTGPAGFTSSNASPVLTNCQATNAGNYTVTITDNNGCTGLSSATLTVYTNPSPTASNTGPYCLGETLNLSVQNFSSYSWTGPSGYSSSLQNPSITGILQSQTGVYHVTVTDSHGCTGTSNTVVEANPSPYLTISGETLYCQGDNINLNCSPGGLPSYHWSGPNSYSSSLQNPVISSAIPVQSGTYTVSATNSYGCTGNASVSITVMPQVNATITPVPPLCYNDPTVTLTAVTNGGIWSGTGVTQDHFDPSDAGSGNHTISYSVQNSACSDSDEITVSVYDNIDIINFTDNECDDTYTEYTVSFDVVDQFGDLTGFLVDIGTGFQQYTNSFSMNFPSETPYHITVTDFYNQCDVFELTGVRNCGCLTSAGNMSSLQTVMLCYGDCSSEVTHSGNQTLDANDTFGFILHDGLTPLHIFATGLTPNFCFHLIPGLSFGTTYYISAVAGNEVTPGVPDYNDPCISVSPGTPVIWYANPVAHIITNDFSVCGLEASFSASPPSSGMNGHWGANASFYTTNETTYSSPNISVLVPSYGIYDFVWYLTNAVCTGSDTIHVEFVSSPNAYAGEDYAICGTSAQLSAVLTYPSSTGNWTGAGQYTAQTSPQTEVNINSLPGPYTFTWRETIGDCWDEDQVTVTFIPSPNPIIYPITDTVCGTIYELSVNNVQGTGIWSAYSDGQLLPVAPFYVSGITSPNTVVIAPNYPGDHQVIDFVWTETSMVAGIQCITSASTSITFARVPVASVGAVDEAEICGNSYLLNADTTGSSFGNFSWISPSLLASFDDASNPQATITILSLGSFGDSAYVRAPIIWAIENYGCSSMDTMWITFYRRPVANAGLDDAVCGNNYQLEAFFDITASTGYTPSGSWTTHNPPLGQIANISPSNNNIAQVTVSAVGIWNFVFRENNSFLTSCYSTDTVQIEFIENPVIFAGEDKDVCGQSTQLEGITGGFNGSWIPNGVYISDFSDPNSSVTSNTYSPINFVWLESNQFCTVMDTVTITFWRKPTANILTDPEDNSVCGLTFEHLRAESPGSEIEGYWYNINPATVYGDPFSNSTWATVPNYGFHDFYWIEQTGPDLTPGFCTDTAGPLTINFIQIPNANAGGDTLFCGYCGYLHAIPSVGQGVWSTPSFINITYADENLYNTQVCSNVINTGNPTYPNFTLIWTEDNSNGCTDSDTMKVIFARVPSSNMQIIAPKCFGEPATIAAAEEIGRAHV
jgi:hypothetical protein